MCRWKGPAVSSASEKSVSFPRRTMLQLTFTSFFFFFFFTLPRIYKNIRVFLSRRRRWNCILRLSEPRGASSFVSSFICAARWAPIAAEPYLWKHTAPPVRTSPRRAERLSCIWYRPPLPIGLLRNDCSSCHLIPSCREIIRYYRESVYVWLPLSHPLLFYITTTRSPI